MGSFYMFRSLRILRAPISCRAMLQVTSSPAWPPGSLLPKATARGHARLEKLLSENFDLSKMRFRKLQKEDQPELEALHSEWFPVRYPQSFYAELFETGSMISLAAVLSSNDAVDVDILLGVITFRIRWPHSRFDMESVMEGGSTACMAGRAMYIPTLGVIDACRGKGIASELLHRGLQHAKEVQPNLQAVWLHVVDYNDTALRFYERAGFRRVRRFRHFYHFFERPWDSILLVHYLDGAAPPASLPVRVIFHELQAFPSRVGHALFQASARLPDLMQRCCRRKLSSHEPRTRDA